MKSDETMGEMETLRGAGFGGGAGDGGWTDTMSEAMTKRVEGGVLLAGRYRVVKRLGEGGMGSVWLAVDLKLDGKRFAIKMLPSVLAGKKGAYRHVKAEALMAMKLAHPNIATVRAFEEDEGGSPFLVIDYIDGVGLDDILAEKGALGESETVKLLGPVAAALDYAHKQGVVHRDVKPGNIIVDKKGIPFVLDFGIAREIQETMTRVTGKFSSGTLLYMSPEQLHGRAPKAAQDVYSFAAMAYECLAGRPPFSRGQIEYQIDHDAPEALPEEVAGAALRAGVMAGLAKEAGGRPGSCAGVLGGKGREREVRVREAERQEEERRRFVLKQTERERQRAAQAAETERERKLWRLTGMGVAALVMAGLIAWGVTTIHNAREEARRQEEILQEEARRQEEMKQEETRQKAVSKATAEALVAGMVHCPGVAPHFWMGKTEVTQEQWEGIMGKNPSWYRNKPLNPVENVSWNDCKTFVDKLNALPAARSSGLTFRLPTAEEWETACRAGAPKAEDYCKIEDGTQITAETLGKVAWYNEGWDMGSTHPVGTKEPNAWGLYDMYGNVWEWTETAVGGGRVYCGGCFANTAGDCAAGGLFRASPDSSYRFLGFRLAASGRTATR